MIKKEHNSGLNFIKSLQKESKNTEKDITVSCKIHVSDAAKFKKVAQAYGLSEHKILKNFILNSIKEFEDEYGEITTHSDK